MRLARAPCWSTAPRKTQDVPGRTGGPVIRYGRGMTIELRTMSADDWETWRSVRLAALVEAPGAFASRAEDWAEAPEDRWRQRLSIPGALDLLAFESATSDPVGMATGVPHTIDGTRVEIISLWVAPAARGRGIAGALIGEIAHRAARTGATTLALSVMSDNVAARRTYEGNGFTVCREPVDPLPDGRRELVMLRELDTVMPRVMAPRPSPAP